MDKNREPMSVGLVVDTFLDAVHAVAVEPRIISKGLNDVPAIAIKSAFLLTPCAAYIKASQGSIEGGVVAFAAAYALQGGLSLLLRERFTKNLDNSAGK